MKKICHVTSTPQNFIPRILRECSSALKISIKPYIVAQGVNYEKDGITFIGVKKANNRILRMLFTSAKLYKEAVKIDADIYQLHDPELLLFARRLKRKGKTVIFDSHEFYGEQIREKKYIPGVLRNLIANIYMRYEAYVCKHIDATLAVCTLNGKDYFKGRSKKTVFISNASRPNVFISTNSIPLENRNNIVYVGALTYERGITHIMKATAKTKAKLVLVGEYITEQYQNEIENMTEYECAEYRGFLDKSDVIKVLDTCRIGIATLLDIGQYHKIDTLPTKVYEYMSMGIPVIISDYPYARQMVEKYKFGICVNPADVDEMARVINYLMDNPQIAIEMGKNGRKAILEELNWEIEENKLNQMYLSF